LRACKRCGFLNPDKAEYCMKCRGEMGSSEPSENVRLVGNPLGGAPSSDDTPQKPKLGEGGLDEPPSWADKPELVAPRPDLDDTFAGRGLDVGGYEMGGVTRHEQPAGPAISDAFAIMTSNSALSGSGEVPSPSKGGGKKKGRQKSKKQKAPPQDMDGGPVAPPGGINGLPPDLVGTYMSYGGYEDDSDAAPQPSSRPAPSPGRRQPKAPVSPPRAQAAPSQSYPPPAPGMAGPPGATPPPVPAAPLGPVPGEPRQPVVKRPIPKAAPAAAAAQLQAKPRREKRQMPSMPKPDLSFLTRARDRLTARTLLAALAALLVLFAVIYLLVGGDYFSSDAQGLLESAQRATSSVASVHVQAEIVMNTEKAGTINTAVSADVSGGRDVHAAYAPTAFRNPVEFVSTAGKTFVKDGAGPWVSGTNVTIDLTPSALFADASGSKLIDQQAIDGVTCDHISFEAGPKFAASLFPDAEVSEATTVDAEIWVDQQQKYVRHVRLDASNLEAPKVGNFSCHVEASLTPSSTPIQISAPI
jgi:hypothetical protein